MRNVFEIAGGSIAGRDHRHSLTNTQDAFCWDCDGDTLVAVVCDGCGSEKNSEVGAQIGCRLVAKDLLNVCKTKSSIALQANRILDEVARDLTTWVGRIADLMAGDQAMKTGIICQYFLFTVVAAIMTRYTTCVAMAGDGVFIINGEVFHKTSKDNKPDYLSYGAMNPSRVPSFSLVHMRPTCEVNSLVIGSDGLADLIAAADKNIPGKDEKVGPISQFWERDLFFRNPFAIQHRLNLINRSASHIDWAKQITSQEHGPMTDDTTLVSIRRKTHA